MEILLGGQSAFADEADAGVHRLDRLRLGNGLHVLHVGRDDHSGHRPLRGSDAQGAVETVVQGGGDVDLLHVRAGHVLVQAQQVDLLLLVAPHDAGEGLADDGDHGLVVELGVVEAVEEVDRTGPRRGHAHAHLSGELGVGAGHERGHLLVTRLHELGLVPTLAQRPEDPVDAITGKAVQPRDTPLLEPRHQVVADCFRHRLLSSRVPLLPHGAPRVPMIASRLSGRLAAEAPGSTAAGPRPIDAVLEFDDRLRGCVV